MTLSTREQRRLMVLNHVGSGAISGKEAAALLGLSERQLRRLRRAYEQEGAQALAHGNRGRRPVNAVDTKLKARVIRLATTRYTGFNQQHFTEMLVEREGIALSRATVNRILTQAGIASPRRRRPPRAHRRRDRFPREGMLLQIDGSRHDWLEGRGPFLSLVGAIDDATGLVPWACFREQEDAQGYFEVMRETVCRKGVPLAVYSDRHSIFFQTRGKDLTLQEQLDGRRQPTQFGRLLEQLGIQLILARSPQAKGRVERLWGTFQDRLTSELRLAGVTTAQDAQRLLVGFLARHNRRFTVPAHDATPAWLPAPDRRRHDQLFCFKYRKVVANDHSIRFEGQRIDIPPGGPRPSYARAEVDFTSTSTAASPFISRTAVCSNSRGCRGQTFVYGLSPHTPKPLRKRSPRTPWFPDRNLDVGRRRGSTPGDELSTPKVANGQNRGVAKTDRITEPRQGQEVP